MEFNEEEMDENGEGQGFVYVNEEELQHENNEENNNNGE